MAQQIKPRNWLNFTAIGIVPLFILAHFAFHLTTALTVPLLPYIRDEFALDYTQAGLMIAAYNVTNGFSQMPGGWLADKIGSRFILTIGIVGVGFAGLVVGFSQTQLILAIGLILMGILGGGYHPSAPTVISSVVEPKRRGLALGLHMVGGSSSYFICPIIAAAIAGVWSWRGSFTTMAIPQIAFGIFFYTVLKRRVPNKLSASKVTEDEGLTPVKGRMRRLIIIIVLSTVAQAIMNSAIAFFPLYMVDSLGTTNTTAAMATSLIYACGFWGGPLGGYLGDRWGRLFVNVLVCFLAAPVVFLVVKVPSGFLLSAVLVALGTSMYVNTSSGQALVVDHTTWRNRSTMMGIYFFGSMEGSGVLSPLVGNLIDRMGFSSSFTILAVAILVSTSVCALLLRTSRSKAAASPV